MFFQNGARLYQNRLDRGKTPSQAKKIRCRCNILFEEGAKNQYDKNAIAVVDEGDRVLAYLRWPDARHVKAIFVEKINKTKIFQKPKEKDVALNRVLGLQQQCAVAFK